MPLPPDTNVIVCLRGWTLFPTKKVAAAVLAGARASPKLQEGTAAEDALVCVNVSMSKTALEVIICALPTDLVYNRCVRGCLCERTRGGRGGSHTIFPTFFREQLATDLKWT